eukprot:TRINITY_DN5429_c0_g2_i7.p1 TRINITY_DN5429_c0_g2~~TRINITY_DN5429_c0_g2_i7.p1  ORF type:complete len:221 (+),score=36.67 TRINITY_DN5429_c0_g2_i7:293-955(+)
MLYGSGVKTVDISDCTELTTIGSNFLRECPNLECVRLPPSVVNIGDDMLHGSGVKVVDLSHCTEPTTIGSNCFRGCRALECVHLPTRVVSIGDTMLSGSGVKTVDLSDYRELATIGSFFLSDCRAIVDLSDCTGECVRLPPSVEKIGKDLLRWSGVKSVDLSDCTGLTWIKCGFLAGCRALECVHLPPQITDENLPDPDVWACVSRKRKRPTAQQHTCAT